MRTCTAKRIFEASVRLGWGLDPDTASLTAAQKARVAESVNDRVAEAFESAFFTETMTAEQREYRETYSATENYAADDEVYYSGGYYKSLLNANVGHDPATATTWWEAVDGTTFVRWILKEQPDETVIHRADLSRCIFDKDPRIYNDAGRMRFVTDMDDRLIVQDADAPVQPWVRFQITPPEFSWTDWSAMTTYAIGDLCYVSSTGNTYVALLPSTNKNPTSETTYWAEVGFPHFLLDFVKHAVAADLMQEDSGRFREEAKAGRILERLQDTHVGVTGEPRKAIR